MLTTRPPLPLSFWNPHLKTATEGSLPQVKYQVLRCNGQDILVGRLKIETPTTNGHAFILRRYDTGAVSLTTMFRAAFPNAPEVDEKSEVQWVRDNHNLAGNNGSSREPHIIRLAGTWVDPTLALELGQTYELGPLIQRVVEAQPDPNVNYRRQGKSAQNEDAPPSSSTTTSVKPPSKSLPTPSPTATVPNPPKRRKESSPSPSVVVAPPPKASAAPAPRRSTRTKSPQPKTKHTPSIMSVVPPSKKSKRDDSPAGEVDPDSEKVEDIGGTDLFEQDIAEQQEMIRGLKAAKSETTPSQKPKSKSKVEKRAREEEKEEKLKFDFKEPEIGERVIATNKRVGLFRNMEPRSKSAAWGLGLFVFGASAVTLLPNFF